MFVFVVVGAFCAACARHACSFAAGARRVFFAAGARHVFSAAGGFAVGAPGGRQRVNE